MIERIYKYLMDHPEKVLWPVAYLVATFALGWLVRRLILKALNRWSIRSGSRAPLILTESLRGPLLIWAFILAGHLAIKWSELPPAASHWSAELAILLWVVSLTLMSMRAAANLVRHYGENVSGPLPVTSLTQNLAQLAVFILGALYLLHYYQVNITPILTALGVGGLAVALALQDTLSNLFAGCYVAVAGQVRLGDYIKLNSGEAGYVADIGWRSTTMRDLSNNLIIVPNAKLSQAIVTNYHLPERSFGSSVQVNVSYESDPDQVERVLADVGRTAAGEVAGLLSDPVPSVTFEPGMGEYSLGFTLGYQVKDFASQFAVRNELKKRILRRFREEGIRIPLPSRTLFLHEDTPAENKT